MSSGPIPSYEEFWAAVHESGFNPTASELRTLLIEHGQQRSLSASGPRGCGTDVSRLDPLSSAELLVPATRYYLGRMTIAAAAHARALAAQWMKIPCEIRRTLRADVQAAFEQDDAARARVAPGPTGVYPLGMDVDRECWQLVRRAWKRDRASAPIKGRSA